MHVHVCKFGLSIDCMLQCLKEKFLNDAREAIGAMMNTQVEALCLERDTLKGLRSQRQQPHGHRHLCEPVSHHGLVLDPVTRLTMSRESWPGSS